MTRHFKQKIFWISLFKMALLHPMVSITEQNVVVKQAMLMPRWRDFNVNK